jgi:hypothetical protein
VVLTGLAASRRVVGPGISRRRALQSGGRENRIRAEGPAEADAWRAAVAQARSVGMLGGWRVPEPGAV